MELRQLKYFVQICKDRSFTKACSNLFISQQGLSISIKRLEEELGCRLLHRTEQGYLPTPQGEYLLERAEQMLSLAQECEAYFRRERQSATCLTVACVVGLIGYNYDFFTRFMLEDAGERRVKFVEKPTNRCEEMLLKGEANCAFVPGPMDPKLFQWHPLFRVPNYAVLHRSNPLAREKSLSFEQLRGQKLITFNQEFKVYHQLRARCRQLGFEPNIVLTLDQTPEIFHFVQNNPTLIGISHAYGVRRWLLPELWAVPVGDDSFCWEVNLAWKKGEPRSELEDWFQNETLAFFQTHPFYDGETSKG